MAEHFYRFRLPSGEVYESDDPRTIRRAYPEAVITHRVDFDDYGQSHVVPFEGDPGPAKKAAAAPVEENADEKADDKPAAKARKH